MNGSGIDASREILESIEVYCTASFSGLGDGVVCASFTEDASVRCFVRREGAWSTLIFDSPGNLARVSRSEAGDVFVWASEGRGDPPPGYSGAFLSGKGVADFVTRFDSPADLNSPDWYGEAISLDDFNIAADGSGRVIASALIEREGPSETWYFEYRTIDGGRTWTAATRIAEAGPVSGIYIKSDETDEVLYEEILRRVS